ncbi:unnamed protein product [Pleuronectes platessa]|uniref:Uncharacterized protein n=1 Tax=Pleuronectes platessa TaxID=8262 RepID=A0A9N7YGC5_PLEPL|nr:unnamed protein product [Pleuronectes platessa]
MRGTCVQIISMVGSHEDIHEKEGLRVQNQSEAQSTQSPLGSRDWCSYVPPCERDNQKNRDSVLWWEDYFTKEVSSQSFTCFFNQQRRPDDVLWRRSHDTSVLLHCVLWPMVSLLLGTLIVLLTVCARSLAVRAEALQKRKCSYEVCQDLSASASERRGTKAGDPPSTNSDAELSSPSRTLPLFAVPVRRRDREH